MSVLFEKKFPPSPTFESLNIRKTPIIESLIASLSGNLDEYDIQFTGRSIIARAKKSYQDRYRTAAATAASLEKRLSVVEAVLARSEAARAHTETVLKRSQMYTSLLSSTSIYIWTMIIN
jgi:hypothetical protein